MKREYDFHALALRYGFHSKDMEKAVLASVLVRESLMVMHESISPDFQLLYFRKDYVTGDCRSPMRMETFLLKVLNCPPNEQLFLEILEKKLGLRGFRLLSLEFPLVQDEDYGFVDIFGSTETDGAVKYAFIEAKWGFPGAEELAREELKEYSQSYSRHGLFSDDMTKLYHQTVFDRNGRSYDPKGKSAFLPLVIDTALVEDISEEKVETVITRYSNFIGQKILQRVPTLKGSLHEIQEGRLVPRYPNFVANNDEVKLVMYCYDFLGNSLTKEIPWSGTDLRNQISTREKTDLNNSQIFDILSNVQTEGTFVIHYSMRGYHRPNLFLETEKGKFLCLQHMGLRGLNYMGTYDEKAALDYEDSLIYSTVLVDRGRYWITEAKNQVVKTQLVGKRFNGSLRLSFGASISLRTKFAFKTSQSGLAHS